MTLDIEQKELATLLPDFLVRQRWYGASDLELVAGNRDKLIGKLQERYGFEKDRALDAVDKFISDLKLTPKSHPQER